MLNRLRYLTILLALLLSVSARGAAPSFLHAEGRRILNEAGTEVVLSGLNLGGWLVEEMWMLPFTTVPPSASALPRITSHVTLWQTIENRFGRTEMLRLRKTWRDTWVTQSDFERIKGAGVNCVRLPFLFDSIEEPDGVFPWIDRALGWARELGLYVILDLHGAPGRQSVEHHTGQADVNKLFKDPAMVAQTLNVWRRIAKRYADHPEVAGYDLLNEPMGAPNDATLYVVQDSIYRAIREIDSRHLIFIEDGYKGIEQMPDPAVVGWQNVVFSPHCYNFSAKNEADHGKNLEAFVAKIEKQRGERQVPIYIGEFNIEPHASTAMLSRFLETFKKQGISWALWTYKSAMRNGGGGMWSWYRSPSSIRVLDPFYDSVPDLIQKMEQVRTEKLEESPMGKVLRGQPGEMRVARSEDRRSHSRQ